MPYPNESSARCQDHGKYERFVRKNIAPGIDIIIGYKQGGGSETQAYRFDIKRYTPAEARAWLKEHNVKYISFEGATNK